MNKIGWAVIGPVPPPLGGATVLFAEFAGYLRSVAPDVGIYNSRGMGLRELLAVLTDRRHKFILLNISSSRVRQVVWLAAVCLLLNKSFAVRGFGGGWDEDCRHLGVIDRRMFLWALGRAAFVCFETKQLVEFFARRCRADVKWLPNYRDVEPDDVSSDCGSSGKFVFVGRVCEEKGVGLILEAASMRPDKLEVDIYGPLDGGYTLCDMPGVTYRGELPPAEVVGVISRYRALILPTTWRGEGYPGIILEAFNAGVPVISVDWRAIPELFEGNRALIIQPGDAGMLAEAMVSVVDGRVDLARIIEEQKRCALQFDAKYWNPKLLGYCLAAVGDD